MKDLSFLQKKVSNGGDMMFLFSILISCIFSPIRNMHDYSIYGKWIAVILILSTWILLRKIIPAKNEMKCSDISNVSLLVNIILISHCTLQHINILPRSNVFFISCSGFENPAGIAAILVLLFPLECYGKSFEKNKLYISTVFTLNMITLCIVSSRIGLLSIFIEFLLEIRFNKRIRIATTIMMMCFLAIISVVKTDSTRGRSLIYTVSLQMITKKPIFGYGPGGFNKQYMLYQANYLNSENTDNRYAILADNITHPLSEIILLTVNYGIVGIFIISCAILFIIKKSLLQDQPIKKTTLQLIIGFLALAFFSYPFRYPSVLVAVFFVMSKFHLSICKHSHNVLIGTIFAILFISTGFYYFCQSKWFNISKTEISVGMIEKYEKITNLFSLSPRFLYNYAMTMYSFGDYSYSLELAEKSMALRADYNTVMLLANLNRDICKIAEAEYYYKLAHNMCPSRFIPLYCQFNMYRGVFDDKKAQEIGQIILSKEIKINSDQVDKIRFDVRKYMYGLN